MRIKSIDILILNNIEWRSIMGFRYNKLWKLLIDNNMKKTDLKEAILTTPSTMSRLSKNENVSMDILGRICEYFNCDIGDIVEYVSEKKEVVK